jgi:hypothetical protein
MNLGTAAATVLASGTIAAIVSHLLVGVRERRGLLRQKAEYLYVSIEALENSWSINVVALHRCVTGAIDYNGYLDAVIRNADAADGTLNRRVEMLTRIYFPTATAELARVRAALDTLNHMTAVHKAAYLEGHDNKISWKEHFEPLVNGATASFHAYKDAVVRCAQASFTPLRLKT